MKTTFLYIFHSALFIVGTVSVASAQKPGDTLKWAGRQRILKMKEDFILNRVPFTPQETENFLKILRKFEQRRAGLMKQLRENRRRLGPESGVLSSDEINRLLDQRMNLERLLLEEKERYIKTLRQMFPAERVMEILRAEREFMRSMFHKLKDFPHDRDEPGPPPPHHPPYRRNGK